MLHVEARRLYLAVLYAGLDKLGEFIPAHHCSRSSHAYAESQMIRTCDFECWTVLQEVKPENNWQTSDASASCYMSLPT